MPRVLALLMVASLAGGCSHKRASTATSQTKPAPTVAPWLLPEPPLTNGAGETQEKRPRYGESLLYVDGKTVAAVRVPELPPSVKPMSVHIGGGSHVMRYSVGAYLRGLHIDPARVKAVHFYGGKRIAVVDHDEMLRVGDRILLGFTAGDRGKPRIHWPAIPLKINTTIDMLTNIAVYVDKEPPKLVERELVMPDGTPVGEKVPYAPEEQGSGTRVYVDGTLVGTVKRKRITPEMLLPTPASASAAAKTAEPTEGNDRYALLAYATSLDPSAARAKVMDVIAGDDVILRSTRPATVAFDVPRRNRGQAVVDVPGQEAAPRRARVSAIQLYVKTTPPPREIAALDEAPEASLGGGHGRGSASSDEL